MFKIDRQKEEDRQAGKYLGRHEGRKIIGSQTSMQVRGKRKFSGDVE